MKTSIYQACINDYKRLTHNNPDPWIEDCKEMNLEKAIRYAARARTKLWKKHPHQARRTRAELVGFAQSLSAYKTAIERTTSFQGLIRIATLARVKGIGPLTIYDTCTRIAANLGVEVDRIYLHAGTRVGAERILGERLNVPYILKTDLPPAFQRADLDCGEIEDILCIYKDDFIGLGARLRSLCGNRKHVKPLCGNKPVRRAC
jgi:hypothetical protein